MNIIIPAGKSIENRERSSIEATEKTPDDSKDQDKLSLEPDRVSPWRTHSISKNCSSSAPPLDNLQKAWTRSTIEARFITKQSRSKSKTKILWNRDLKTVAPNQRSCQNFVLSPLPTLIEQISNKSKMRVLNWENDLIILTHGHVTPFGTEEKYK